MAGYQISSNLTERQIESDVAMYLGWCSEGMPFRLLDVDEQATGADRLFDVTVPIYLQFKKSLGLKPIRQMASSRRMNESALELVRRFRDHHQLADDPTLYFQLRKKAPGAADLQHNVLFAHHHPSQSYAVYVAPLYLDKDIYAEELCRGPRGLIDPWEWRRTNILNAWRKSSWLSRYDRQPFLRNHISIAPHTRVADHKHFYAFSTTGDEVSWHSPELINGGPFRLSDFMSARTRQLLVGEAEFTTPADALAVAQNVLEELKIDIGSVTSGDNEFDRLRSYGRWLHNTFRIRQLLICGRRGRLLEARKVLEKQ